MGRGGERWTLGATRGDTRDAIEVEGCDAGGTRNRTSGSAPVVRPQRSRARRSRRRCWPTLTVRQFGRKNQRCQAAASPSGGRYRGSVASAVSPRRRGDLAKTHLSSRSSRPSGTTRDAVRARVSGSRARDNPYIRKTTRRQRPDWPHTKSSLRAISISKLTMGFGLDSVVFFRDWFDREVPTEGATAHGLATDEAECTEAGYPRSVRVIPERVGRETCRRSRR
jgi:hypothetical protein